MVISRRRASCSGVPKVWEYAVSSPSEEEKNGEMTDHFGRDSALVCVLLVSKVDEVELNPHKHSLRCLQVLRLTRIPLDFCNGLDGYVLHLFCILAKLNREIIAHHIAEGNVHVMALGS